MSDERPGRPVYGIQEIARELDVNSRLVATWRQRRSHAMPEPDAELAGGAVWLADTIEPWIARMRESRSEDRQDREVSLFRVLARRTFRLAAVLNEDTGLRAGVIRYLTLELARLTDDLEALKHAPLRNQIAGMSPGVLKLIYDLPQLITQATLLVDGVPRKLWQETDVTALPPEVEADLMRLRSLVLLEILPPVSELLRQLERAGRESSW